MIAIFDESISLQYLHYSYAAFCQPEALKTWTCEWYRLRFDMVIGMSLVNHHIVC